MPEENGVENVEDVKTEEKEVSEASEKKGAKSKVDTAELMGKAKNIAGETTSFLKGLFVPNLTKGMLMIQVFTGVAMLGALMSGKFFSILFGLVAGGVALYGANEIKKVVASLVADEDASEEETPSEEE